MQDLLGYEGKVCVVTGYASGMGKATCELLIKLGAKVYGMDRNELVIDGMEKFIATDLSNKQSIDSAFAQLPDKIDCFFGVAGLSGAKTSYWTTFTVNFIANKYMTEQYLEKRMDRGGAIVYVTSCGGLMWEKWQKEYKKVMKCKTWDEMVAFMKKVSPKDGVGGMAYTLAHGSYPSVICEIPEWNGTVIRLVSRNRDDIIKLSELVRRAWVCYNNKELGIIAEDENGVHNAISPTVLKTARGYEMNIILRSNITSERYPDGVFHAHPEYHAIKKESIGLIEAQGLFILPGRLEEELKVIGRYIEQKLPLPPQFAAYNVLYDAAVKCGGEYALQSALGIICAEILKNTAVFKDNRHTIEFLNGLGFNK